MHNLQVIFKAKMCKMTVYTRSLCFDLTQGRHFKKKIPSISGKGIGVNVGDY